MARKHTRTCLLCDRQKIIPVHAFIVIDLIVSTYTTRIDHDATLLVGFWVQKVVTFRAKLQGRLETN